MNKASMQMTEATRPEDLAFDAQFLLVNTPEDLAEAVDAISKPHKSSSKGGGSTRFVCICNPALEGVIRGLHHFIPTKNYTRSPLFVEEIGAVSSARFVLAFNWVRP